LERNFYPALRELGHELIESEVDLLPTSRFMGATDGFTNEELEVRARTTEQILAEIRAAHERAGVDLFLSYFITRISIPRASTNSGGLACRRSTFIATASINSRRSRRLRRKRTSRARGARRAVVVSRRGRQTIWTNGRRSKVYHPVPEMTRGRAACFAGSVTSDRDDGWLPWCAPARPSYIWSSWGSASDQAGPAASAVVQPNIYLGRAQPSPGSRASYVAAFRETLQRDGLFCGLVRVGRQLHYRSKTLELAPLFASHAKGAVPFQKIASIFSSYELCLNFSNVWGDGRPASPLIPHVRLRDFEAPMCRTCYLTGHTDEIMVFYEVGKEIDTYRTETELVDKGALYLSHPDAAEKLRRGRLPPRIADHTWKRRFEELFREARLESVKLDAMPLFSVIIPTFNRRRLLQCALESVLRQTITDYEVLVVDDGSTDETKEYLATLGDRCACSRNQIKVRVWRAPRGFPCKWRIRGISR